jgi:hypothetical protein
MIAALREFLGGQAGKIFGAFVCLVGIVLVIHSWRHHLRAGDAATLSRERVFICSETQKAFEHMPVPGEQIPVLSPYSGKNTGYPAEACYWTKDGQIKSDPTWVLLNETIHKPGPTFCPDCGRLVVAHNPRPKPGDKPPPTQDEYQRAHGSE